jgi:hypothetical protein
LTMWSRDPQGGDHETRANGFERATVVQEMVIIAVHLNLFLGTCSSLPRSLL